MIEVGKAIAVTVGKEMDSCWSVDVVGVKDCDKEVGGD